MKRKMTSIAALLTVTLALTSTTFGQPSEAARPGVPSAGPSARLQAMKQEQQIQQLQQQVHDLKAEHQQLVAELRALHEIAVKEKAAETAGTIEKLIGQRRELFREKLSRLERQQQRLQIAARSRTARPELLGRQGRRAPDFTLSSFDGRTFSLSDLKGKIVVLEWINLECPFSMYHYKTKTTMADLAKKYKDKNVVWLAVNSTNNTTAEANMEFAKEQSLPYPILDDRAGRVGRLCGARTTPNVFIINEEGRIVYDGAIDSAPMGQVQPGSGVVNYVDKALSELTTGRDVSTASTPPYGCSVKYASR